MVTSRISASLTLRPLFIDFNTYTDGDAEFKRELTDLMIDNLEELQQTLKVASSQNDHDRYHKICHKVKATLQMLDDQELLDVVEQLKSMLTNIEKVQQLDNLCTDIIRSLRENN